MLGSNNNNVDPAPPQPPSLDTAVISPAVTDKSDPSGSSKHRGWTMEFDLTLLVVLILLGTTKPQSAGKL